ncbi:MAG TPA: hypothetical protein VGC48_07675 [Gemmatimonadales bacterium]|jgi:hypothetical protein|nr:hypothetical protein [Thermoanaerobaculia bacterium]
MRYLAIAFSCAALLSCDTPLASREVLNGVWTLESGQSTPFDPLVLTLVQHGLVIEGSGNAMGVDAPMPLTVDGSVTGPDVVLTFRFNGGGLTGKYSATFDSGRRLSGVAIFSDGGAGSHSLTYTRK